MAGAEVSIARTEGSRHRQDECLGGLVSTQQPWIYRYGQHTSTTGTFLRLTRQRVKGLGSVQSELLIVPEGIYVTREQLDIVQVMIRSAIVARLA